MQQEGLFEAAKKAFFSSDPNASPLDGLAECVAPGSIEEFMQKCSGKPAQAARTKPVPFAHVPIEGPKQASAQDAIKLAAGVSAKSKAEYSQEELVGAGHKK